MDDRRAASDEVARRVLTEAENELRATDPAVELRLEDYDVQASTRAVPGGSIDEFFYTYARTDPPFVVWTGHPMHFTIRVGPGRDDVQVVPGE